MNRASSSSSTGSATSDPVLRQNLAGNLEGMIEPHLQNRVLVEPQIALAEHTGEGAQARTRAGANTCSFSAASRVCCLIHFGSR